MNKSYFLKRIIQDNPSLFQKCTYDKLPEFFKITDKLPIQCKKHGLFYQKPNLHIKSIDGCPHCHRERSVQRCINSKLSTVEFITKSRNRFGDKFDYSKTVYDGKDTPVTLVCPNHSEVRILPSRHYVSPYGCPQCDYEIPLESKRKEILKKARETHNDFYDYSKVQFVNVSSNVEIVCPTHGSFWQTLYNHIDRRCRCPKCVRDIEKISLQEFLIKARNIHGTQYDYKKVDINGYGSMVVIGCPKHGDFTQRAGSHLAGNGCKKCYQENTVKSKEKFIEDAKKIHGDVYDYEKVVYVGNKTKVEIVCSKHGSFWQKPNSHLSGKYKTGVGCPRCAESHGEKAIAECLDKYGINFIREYKIKPHAFRFDFYLPDFNIFIEFHGLQHYKPVELFGGVVAYEDTIRRDEIKVDLVKQHGKLITLTYLDLSNNSVEKTLVKRLKRLYVRWYRVDKKILAFKSVLDVYRYFNLPSHTQVSDVDSEIRKIVSNFEVLF